MANACSFFLDTGRPCGAPALHDSNWCRHHAPKPAEDTEAAAEAPEFDSESDIGISKADLAAYWRSTFHHSILACENEEAIEGHVDYLLNALVDKAICHRSAGRLFAALAHRRVEIRIAEMHNAEENFRAEALKKGIKLNENLFEALKQLMPNQLTKAIGPQTDPVTA